MEEMAFMPYNSQRHCGALQFWCSILCTNPETGVWYVVLVLCCLQCHPLLAQKILDMVGKVLQP